MVIELQESQSAFNDFEKLKRTEHYFKWILFEKL